MSTHIKLYETQNDYEASNPEIYTNVPVVYYVKADSKSYYDNTKKNIVLATGSTYNLASFGDDIKLINNNGSRYTIQYNLNSLKSFLSSATVGSTFKIYAGDYSLYPDTQGSGRVFSYGSKGPSTYTAMGKARTVTWSYNYTLTVVNPYVL